MMVFTIRIEHSLNVAVQRPHDADPREHRRATRCRDQDQGFHRGLPLRGLVLCLRKFGDVLAGVLEGDELTPARQRNRIVETPLPSFVRPQWRRPFLSVSFLKPSGSRGTSSSLLILQLRQGMPAPPHGQACSPSQGLSGWFSHTHPQPSQSKHFMVAARTAYIDDARSHPASPGHSGAIAQPRMRWNGLPAARSGK